MFYIILIMVGLLGLVGGRVAARGGPIRFAPRSFDRAIAQFITRLAGDSATVVCQDEQISILPHTRQQIEVHCSGDTPPPTGEPTATPDPAETPTPQPPPPAGFAPFGTVTLPPDFALDGQGSNIDSIAFWEAPDPAETLMFVTSKDNQRVEVWQYPFVNNEHPPLQHDSFGSDSRVNGVAMDQETGRLYVSVSEPASTVSVFSAPSLQFSGELIAGAVDLESEPNLTLLNQANGERWAYVSANDVVYIYQAETGAAIGQFEPARGLETLAADHFYQVIYIPDENDRSGIYAYNPDGSPYERNGSHNFGDGIFQSDGEGIILYTCPADGNGDDGRGLIVVADQRDDQTDYEFFDRQTWAHLGTLRLEGVSNTDGIASTQRPLPDYPLGLFAAVDDDTRAVGLGWDKILQATGLSCG